MKIPRKKKSYIRLMIIQILIIWTIVILSVCIALMKSSPIILIIGMLISVLLAILLSEYYYSGARFTCPKCKGSIKPSRVEFMCSMHVKKGREFRCPQCGDKVVSIEGFINDTEDKEYEE